jgi:hypothetical protein
MYTYGVMYIICLPLKTFWSTWWNFIGFGMNVMALKAIPSLQFFVS